MVSNNLIPLQRVLEIEGLIMLLNERGENTPKEIIILLEQKINALRNDIKQLSLSDKAEAESEPANEDADAIAQSALEEECEDADATDCDSNCDEEPTVIIPPIPETTATDDIIAPQVDSVDIKTADIVNTECDTITQIEDDQPANNIDEPATAQPVVKKKNEVKFTLNDKYIFRRELFNFSDEEMQDALQVVSEMSSIEELEDYFYNDLCWDPENEVVKNFMGIVTSQLNTSEADTI